MVTQARTKLAPLTIFESEFGKLNDAQRRGVETIDGPVMVIAGPGTGKTQTVAMRVAHILRKTQMRPSNILCLTYSVSGATAMRERLRLLIGPDAYGVTVATIHGFAQSVIDRHAEVFEEWSVKNQISTMEQYRELNTIIDQVLPHALLLNPRDPYAKDSDLLSRISQVKREGEILADLERSAVAYDEAMAGKSRPTSKQHRKNLAAAKKFRDFIEIFRRYQAMLEEKGRYDYDDMILTVLRALEEEDWMLAGLQERYQYVLVDEFQDTNGAQWRLIDRLTRFESLPHDPNLFVVGDDDQAIYRFQGANVANMLAFLERFPKSPVITLTVSYRSTQAILSSAECLIGQNSERLVGKVPGLQKHLTAASNPEGPSPTLLRAASDLAEPWLIADLVEDRIRASIEPEEIAVLVRTNAELPLLHDVLRARGIPVLLHGKADLLAHPLVAQALTILGAIENPQRDAPISAALACDCFALHPADLGRIQSAARERKARILDVLLSIEDESALRLRDPARVTAVRDALLSLHQKIPVRSVLETVENVLRECGLVAASSAPAPLDLAAVETFFRSAKDWCQEHPSRPYKEFLSDLRFYADPQYGQARLTYELPHLVTSGVQLMTAHQSKGREFKVVILANFRDGHWDKKQHRSLVAIPEDLLFGWDKEQRAAETHQDERRLAYVAMTRAKRELLFTCPREQTVGEKSRSIAPSAFFAEAGPLPELDGELRDPEGASLLLRPRVRRIDGDLEAYLRQKLETFSLSATTLRRFLTDPQQFLLVDLLDQPEHFDESSLRALGYGSAVHWALRQWATSRKKDEPFELTSFLESFAWYLQHKTILTERQWQDLALLGQQSLPRYFEKRLADQRPVLHAVEREYHARLGDIPMKGKIDRIDLASSSSGIATVIDYKTGTAKSESSIRGSIGPDRVSRSDDGAAFRQLAFYALLLERADPLLQPESFVLDFIGERGEDPVLRAFPVTDTEKDDLRGLIRDVWAKIQALDFTPL